MAVTCFLAPFSDRPCDGPLRRVHLIPCQLLRRELGSPRWRTAALDGRSWVWACGGPMGNGGHHGMLDQSRTLRVPRAALPAGTVALAAELGLAWWLDREYPEAA